MPASVCPAAVLPYCTFQDIVRFKMFILVFVMYHLCEKYCKPIIVQYYIADRVSWVLSLTLLDLTKKLDSQMCSQNSFVYKELTVLLLGWDSGHSVLSVNIINLKRLYQSGPLVSYNRKPEFSSVQFSRSVVSNSLRPHESQHARPPCPSPTPGAHSDSRPSSQWCHSAISSSVVPFSSCPQSLPASGSFHIRRYEVMC